MKRVLSTGDIASVNAAVDDGDNDGVFTQVRSRKNRKKWKNITANVNRSQQPSRAKAVGLNLSSSTTQEHDVGQEASQSELSKVVQELRETVNTQQIIIDKLKCRVDFVLSNLDIDVQQQHQLRLTPLLSLIQQVLLRPQMIAITRPISVMQSCLPSTLTNVSAKVVRTL